MSVLSYHHLGLTDVIAGQAKVVKVVSEVVVRTDTTTGARLSVSTPRERRMYARPDEVDGWRNVWPSWDIGSQLNDNEDDEL
jgi:hypothetical protein